MRDSAAEISRGDKSICWVLTVSYRFQCNRQGTVRSVSVKYRLAAPAKTSTKALVGCQEGENVHVCSNTNTVVNNLVTPPDAAGNFVGMLTGKCDAEGERQPGHLYMSALLSSLSPDEHRKTALEMESFSTACCTDFQSQHVSGKCQTSYGANECKNTHCSMWGIW